MCLLEKRKVAFTKGLVHSPAAGSMDLAGKRRPRLRIARRLAELVEKIVSEIPIECDAEKKARALQQISRL